MLVYWILGYILLTNAAQANTTSPACERGFSPLVCRYKCNCRDRLVCTGLGDCVGPCKRTYFGPGCQFVDILSFEQNDEVPYFLRDFNDRSCNIQPHNIITVNLLNRLVFSWFRVIVNRPDVLLNFTTRFNDGDECLLERKFKVDNRTVDVTCQMNIIITQMIISGIVAPSVCTIYISSGRNLAIRETTRQSSTFERNNNSYGPHKAVDTFTNQTAGEQNCAQTDTNIMGSWWSVNFTHPVTLYRLKVYNRHDDKKNRLNRFSLKTYTRSKQLVSDLEAGLDFVKQEFLIIVTIPVSYMVIRQSRDFPSTELALTLCEVEAFGDYKCPQFMYGLSCEHSCNCSETEDCHYITGRCAAACPLGTYGRRCNSSCSTGCKNVVCNFMDGSCTECRPGYRGLSCNIVCSSGRWGVQCVHNCSQHCPINCNRINGDCICQPGFSGQRCKECTEGTFGVDCGSNCSEGCVNTTCHHVTGHCLCNPGYLEPRCEACPIDSYGLRCTLSCSKGCNDTCNHINGKCFCTPGYIGSLCEACPPGSYGEQCALNCSEGCNNTCYHTSGHCLCKPGYMFSTCQECPAGSYGMDCAASCSIGCNNTCNHLTGNCLCKFGFVNSRCEECPAGFYGSRCDDICSQGCTYTCNHETGDCLCKPGFVGSRCEDCARGIFGTYCNLSCSLGCENNTCDEDSLKCFQCKLGFIGDRCEECEYGFYGTLCDIKCSSLCVNDICDKETGHCRQCKFGLTLEQCKDCPEHFYGILCTKKCPSTCASATCDRETGKCGRCLHIFTGDHCNECPQKTYGYECTLKCSSTCLNMTCEKLSGRCSGCPTGFSGDNCEVKEGMSPYWLLIILFFAFGVFALMYTQRTEDVLASAAAEISSDNT